jgi:hypothetical protein
MKTVRMKIDVQSSNAKPIGRIDVKRVDASTEADIAPDGHPNSPTYGHVKLPHLS